MYTSSTPHAARYICLSHAKSKKAVTFDGKTPVKTTVTPAGTVLTLPDIPADTPDYIIELTTAAK